MNLLCERGNDVPNRQIPQTLRRCWAEWCLLSLDSVHDLYGIHADSFDYNVLNKTYYDLPISDGITACSIRLQAGENWFIIGNQIG